MTKQPSVGLGIGLEFISADQAEMQANCLNVNSHAPASKLPNGKRSDASPASTKSFRLRANYDVTGRRGKQRERRGPMPFGTKNNARCAHAS